MNRTKRIALAKPWEELPMLYIVCRGKGEGRGRERERGRKDRERGERDGGREKGGGVGREKWWDRKRVRERQAI